jgi:FMN-dependent NADH-azoreductase
MSSSSVVVLLQIDSSPLGPGASFSRDLTAEFVDRWRATNPDSKVIHRDLAHLRNKSQAAPALWKAVLAA